MPFGHQLVHVGRQPNRLRGVDDGPANGLLDPVGGVGTETDVHVRIERFDRPQQTEISFRNKIGEVHALVRIAAGDVDNEAEVGSHHLVTRFGIPLLHACGELFFPQTVSTGPGFRAYSATYASTAIARMNFSEI